MPVRYLGMSQNTSATPSTPRVPHAAQGVDVNFCRKPKCENFGVPSPQAVQRGPGASNPYTVVANGKNTPAARCNACGEHITLKSNSGVLEESLRILAAHSRDASCPEPLCSNHRMPVHVKGAPHHDSIPLVGVTTSGPMARKCRAG